MTDFKGMEAIVLARRDFREFDKIISFYTKENGKVELLARGVKKIISKNSAHLEPFSYLRVEIAKGKEIDHLTKVIPINFFAKIRQKMDKSLAAGFIVSFLEKMTETGEPDKRIFNLLLGWLKFADKAVSFNFILLDAFMINLFSALGFYPILDKCVICEKSFQNIMKEQFARPSFATATPGKLRPRDGVGGFYFSGGGLICPDCRDKKEYVGEKIIDCGLKETSNMQVLLKGDWRIINEFEFDKQEKEFLHKLVYEFVLFHCEKKVSDWGLTT